MDRDRKDVLATLIAGLAARGTAVLVATHDAEFAAAWADRCVLLGDGRPVADAPLREVLGGGWYFSTQTARILPGGAHTGGGRRVAHPARGGTRMTWIAASFLLLALSLLAGFAWYERSQPTARVLALVAALAALAALGRIAFAPIPNVKPTTDIVLLTGYVLGGAPGFAVGAVSAVASNVFFGQGPWTPWQMGAWGLIGIGGALLARVGGRHLSRWTLAAACALAGLLYGAILNFSMWVLWSGDHTLAKLGSFYATSVAFDLAHALGNVVFCLAFGPALVVALDRFRLRSEVTWKPLPATAVAGAIALVAFGSALAARPQPAQAAAPAASVDYLLKAQNDDGGFPPAPGAGSTQLHTGWTVLGLAAAGRNPQDLGALRYIAAKVRELDDTGELCRTLLVLGAAGVDPRDFAGRDLVRELVRRKRRDGSFSGRVNTTAFAVLALRAAGRRVSDPVVKRAAQWIARQANPDGGFNFAGKGGGSGVDDTGAAVQALVAAGRRSSTTVKRAASFLVRAQNPDGGYPLQPGGRSNAQSAAWAIQALVAAGRDPAKVRRAGARSPLAYLKSLVGPDGAIRYSRTSQQTPVWVTGQAVAALEGKPFPLRRLPRKAVARAAATPAPTRTAAPAATPRPARKRSLKPAAARPRIVASAATLPISEILERARVAGIVTGFALATL